MLPDSVKDLVVQTLQDPRGAAERIIAMQFSRDVLWCALILVAAINSLIYSVSLLFADTSMMPMIFRNPLMFFFIVTGVLVMSVHAFYWVGRSMGGQGELGDLLKLFVWLQALRAGAQAIMLVLILALPMIAPLFSLVVGVLGLWITLHFITAALRLRSLLHGFGVLVFAAIGLIFGLILLAGVIGLSAFGVPTNV